MRIRSVLLALGAYLAFLALVLYTVVASGCAPAVKQRAVQAVAISQTSVNAAQTAERQLVARGAPAEWTEARQLAFHQALVRYYDAEAKAIAALKLYRSGDPVPGAVPEAIAALEEAAGVLRSLAPPGPLASVLGEIEAGAAAVRHALELLTGGL